MPFLIFVAWITLFAIGLFLIHKTARVQRIKNDTLSMKKLSTHSTATTTAAPVTTSTTSSSDPFDSETPPHSPLYNKFTYKFKRKNHSSQQQPITKTCLGLFGAGKSSFR